MKRSILLISLLASTIAFAQPAGNLDLSFGTGGKVVTSISTGEDKAYGTVLQPDGKIVVGGFTTNVVSGKDFACVRYLSDGSLDNSFGVNGIVTTDLQLGSDDMAYDIALQADGKIILAGSSDNGVDRNAALIRYLPDGTIDSTFGVNGIVLTDFDLNYQDEIRAVKIHTLTGNIIVGGSAQINTTTSKPVVARYLSNGTPDSTFNNTGIRLLWITALDYQFLYSIEEVEVQSNGKISAAGWRDFPNQTWESDHWAGRINSDGTMDVTFSTDGVNTYNGSFNGNDRAYAMLLQSGNNMILAGGSYQTTLYYDMRLLQLTLNGASAGSISTDFGSTYDDIAFAISNDAAGNFVLAGMSGTTTQRSFALTRLDPAGALDATFGVGGKVTTTFGANMINSCQDMFIQPDDKIVAAGYTGNDFAIARYTGVNTAQLDVFNLVSPTDGATTQNYSNLVFDWSDAYLATSYEIDVDDNAGFSSPQTYTVVTSTKTVTNLQPNTQYFWRVRASDGSGFGAYSATWSFTTNTLENFNLVSPANNSTNQLFASLTLDWSNALGASAYQVELDSSLTFIDNPQTYNASTSTYGLTNLQPSTDYYWHVRAGNGVIWGDWSVTWKFTTKAASGVGLTEAERGSIVVFPNPFDENITLVTNADQSGNMWQMKDQVGKHVASGTIESTNQHINLEMLASGIYYITVGEASFKIVKK
jgi:uncharacterized delta-60 repeat protein